jgi:putative (di)nucleoside polyphosphate hydrolase
MINFSKKNNHNILPYRPGVGMVILNSSNKVFVGKRIDTKIEGWQMPQGGIDIGETPSAAAMREMEEEIGSGAGYIIAESKFWYSYDLPKFLIPRLWQGRFRGQKQKWFLIRFTGQDKEININKFKPEFSSWTWVDFSELPKIIIPFKRRLYQAVVAEFKEILIHENNRAQDFVCQEYVK